MNDRTSIFGLWERFLQNDETGSGAHPAFYTVDGFAKDGKGWNWPLQFSAEGKNAWSYTSLSSSSSRNTS